MKRTTILVLALLTGGLAAAEKPVPSVPMRDRVSHDALALRYAKKQESMKLRVAKPKPVEPKREEWKPVNILDRSEFLSFRGLATLVPKGALLNVPPALAVRARVEEGARIVRWEEFLSRNRNWIDTFEVTRRQAEAEVPLSEEALKAITKNPRVVVATLEGGPITVLRIAPEAAEQTAAVNTDGTTEATQTTPEK